MDKRVVSRSAELEDELPALPQCFVYAGEHGRLSLPVNPVKNRVREHRVDRLFEPEVRRIGADERDIRIVCPRDPEEILRRVYPDDRKTSVMEFLYKRAVPAAEIDNGSESRTFPLTGRTALRRSRSLCGTRMPCSPELSLPLSPVRPSKPSSSAVLTHSARLLSEIPATRQSVPGSQRPLRIRHTSAALTAKTEPPDDERASMPSLRRALLLCLSPERKESVFNDRIPEFCLPLCL